MIPPSNPERVSAPTSPADILRAARELISTPERWMQGALALDSRGTQLTSMTIERGVCFCSIGALQFYGDTRYEAEAFLERVIGDDNSVGTWNDKSTHAEVLDAFARAIELAEAQS